MKPRSYTGVVALSTTFLALVFSSMMFYNLEAAEKSDPTLAFPRLPSPKPATIAVAPQWPGAVALGTGIRVVPGSMAILDGLFHDDRGPVDGLEVIACLQDGKKHETLIALTTNEADLVKAAVLAAWSPEDGQVPEEGSLFPARGEPVRVRFYWKDDEEQWFILDASSLVRDRVSGQALPALPYVYTGSRFQMVAESGPDGEIVRRQKFMLKNSKTVIGQWNEPDQLMSSALFDASRDDRYEINSAIAPPKGTSVFVTLEAAKLPLTLTARSLDLFDAAGVKLDDPALERALSTQFGKESKPDLRAVAIHIDGQSQRESDLLIRERIVAAAVRTNSWVIPVFVPMPRGVVPAK